MRIVIDAILSGTYVRGVSNYSNNLLNQLAKINKSDDFFIYYGSWMKDYEFLKIKQDNIHFIECNPPQNKLLRNAYKAFVLPHKAKLLSPDIYHVTDTSPLFYHVCPTVSTIHDLAEFYVPEKYGKFQAAFRKLYLPFQIRNSARIITVSEYSKRTIVEHFKVNPKRVVVTYNGIGLKDTKQISDIAYEDRKYFICVSALEKSKNVITLVKGYSKLPDSIRRRYPLKLIGYKASEYEEIVEFIRSAGLNGQVEICDYMNAEQLSNCYKNALALIIPSLYEGFGMPIAESFFYNTPVIASDASCFPEVCNGSALMFSALDDTECAKQMQKYAENKLLWEEYRQKGRERLGAFSWEKTAVKTIRTYESLCPRKKKLLYVVEALGGGVYFQVRDLVNHFSELYEVYLLYAPRKELPDDYERTFAPNVRLIRYPLDAVGANSELNHLNGVKFTRKIINKIKPDVIHLHSSVAGAWGRMAFLKLPGKMIYTPHGFAYLNGTPERKMKVYRLAEAILGKRNCTIAACGRQEYNIAKSFTKKVFLVENGITLENPVEINKEHPFTVMTVGRVCTQKNPELFNQIALELKNIRFIWCGEKRTDFFTAPNIVTTSFLPHDEVIRMMNEADVFMLTSVFEGLSVSLLEAMSLRKLCVVSKTFGNIEVIEHGKNGFLCSTYKEYVDTLQLLAKEYRDNKYNYIRNNARETVENRYSYKEMFTKYEELYQK